MTAHVTHHAIDRYLERVAPVDRMSARDAMLAAARGIETAAAFGGHIVRLPNGARMIVRGCASSARVVTVLRPGEHEGSRTARLSQPVCCGECGLRCSHPIARACVRPDCGLAGRSGR